MLKDVHYAKHKYILILILAAHVFYSTNPTTKGNGMQ